MNVDLTQASGANPSAGTENEAEKGADQESTTDKN
jgi:hypothetical protein